MTSVFSIKAVRFEQASSCNCARGRARNRCHDHRQQNRACAAHARAGRRRTAVAIQDDDQREGAPTSDQGTYLPVGIDVGLGVRTAGTVKSICREALLRHSFNEGLALRR